MDNEPDAHETDDDDEEDDDDEPPGWKPLRTFTSTEESDQAASPSGEDDGPPVDVDETADTLDRVELADPEDIDTDSLQNPHDEDATYQAKNGESHQGYKANLAETCGSEDPFRVITDVQVDTNNTEDTTFLEDVVGSLDDTLGVEEVFTDGGYQSEETEQTCREHDVDQHLSGIKRRDPDPDAVSVAEAEFDGHEMIACPEGYTPIEHEFTDETRRNSGRMPKSVCANCPRTDNCFVTERQEYFSYGFSERHREVAEQRAKAATSDEPPDLSLRAGAESMINEVYHKTGTRTIFTGKIKGKHSSIAAAIGTNIKRVARFLEAETLGGHSPASG